MARLSVDGLTDLNLSFAELSETPDSVFDEMLKAEAEVVAKATREEASKLGTGYGGSDNERHTTESNSLPGQVKSYSTGATAQAVAVSRVKKSSKGKHISVYFKGKRPDGKSAAEIAFFNEYGTRNINARNFVWTANKKSEGESLEAAKKIYDNYLKSKNL